MNKVVNHLYEFGPFVLDPPERLVRHGSARMELPPRAFDTLLVLVQNGGRLMEKDTLMRTVWGDTVVEENNLSQAIYLLRKALRDGEDGVRYIETVPKRGYRFIAPVREIEPPEAREPDRNGSSKSGFESTSRPEPGADSAGLLESSALGGVSSNSAVRDFPRKSVARGWMQGLVAGLAVIAVMALLQAAGWKQRVFGESSTTIRSVAVLPLQNLSNDPSQEYFADGMTDELITDLAQIHELKVVSKTSTMQYKGTRTLLPQIGRELGVDAVVEGSVLRSGDRVRITAQLIRAATDRHIWAESYDGDLKDVLSLQARVAEAITSQVKLNLTAEESGRLRGARAVNPEAFDLYLRGRFAWNQRSVAGFNKAVDYFNQAIQKDPNFALAYSGLADSYTLLVLYGQGSRLPEAKSAAGKALQLNDSLAEAHTSLAAVKILQDWDWQGAEQEFHRAIELNPNFAQAHHWYGNLLLGPQGRHDEAIAELQLAQQLDPLSPIIQADLGFAYFLAGRYDMARQAYQKVAAANPDFIPVHFYLSRYYAQTGEYDSWLKETVKNMRLAGYPAQVAALQQVYARGGFHAVMLEMADPAKANKLTIGSDARQSACSSAAANATLGKAVPALNGLEDCYRWNGTALIYLKVDPVWASMRSESGFQDLLHRIHLQ
jgi:TolB-like protein/DNA-binding winged helix-turn-helix (wHTH) protein/Tfp pilus assembly protein PilF